MTRSDYKHRVLWFLLLGVPFMVMGVVNAILSPGIFTIVCAAFSAGCTGFTLHARISMRGTR